MPYVRKFYVTEDEYADMDDSSQGFCLACGELADGCEPDACNYKCEACGKKQVFGAAELLLMGHILITDSEDDDSEEVMQDEG